MSTKRLDYSKWDHIEVSLLFDMHTAGGGSMGVTIHRTGPHRARTGPEMTDYFTLTTVTSRIKA